MNPRETHDFKRRQNGICRPDLAGQCRFCAAEDAEAERQHMDRWTWGAAGIALIALLVLVVEGWL